MKWHWMVKKYMEKIKNLFFFAWLALLSQLLQIHLAIGFLTQQCSLNHNLEICWIYFKHAHWSNNESRPFCWKDHIYTSCLLFKFSMYLYTNITFLHDLLMFFFPSTPSCTSTERITTRFMRKILHIIQPIQVRPFYRTRQKHHFFSPKLYYSLVYLYFQTNINTSK